MTHPRLVAWWRDDPDNPGRSTLDQPAVQRLIAAIAPASQAVDLGGVMSLNVWLRPLALVLRVHQPFVTRERLLALQELRRRLASQGLVVPEPGAWQNRALIRCGDRWAELESYVPHERLKPSPDAYTWLFGAMGVLHSALAKVDLRVPRPPVATYAPPETLRRWLPVTEAAVRDDAEAVEIAHLLRNLVNALARVWVPSSQLPPQIVHGDVRLSNICRGPGGETVYLDFGFAAVRPRVHDIAYALAFMVLALDGKGPPERFSWQRVPGLIEKYEEAFGSRLTDVERQALVPYAAAVPLYAAALDGFTEDPAGKLRSRLRFLRLSEWLLAHPDALLAPST
jgi:Ser/Thr protein kinase RdoA (MazF antagonist)